MNFAQVKGITIPQGAVKQLSQGQTTLWKKRGGVLPVGYLELIGIDFDGDFHYETGEKLYGSDVITITLDNTSTTGQNVFGSYNGTASGRKNFSLFIYGDGSSSNSYLRYGETLYRPKYGTGKRTLVFGGNGTTDGFATDVAITPGTFVTDVQAFIGWLPNSTSPHYTGDIVGRITAGNRLIWIPVERISDGEIGYYELNSGVFLTKTGTGTPVSLGYLDPLPAGYSLLSYAENPLGNSAYVRTGVTAANDVGFFIDFYTYDQFAEWVEQGYGCLFGGRAGSNNNDFQVSTYRLDANASWGGTFRRGALSQNYAAHLARETRMQASLVGNTYSIGGTDYTTAGAVSNGREIFLFALNNNGSVTQNGHLRVYKFILTKNGQRVRFYLPCKSPSNVVGFYDIINNSFVPPYSGTLTGVE